MKTRKIKGHEYAKVLVEEYREQDGDGGNWDMLVSYNTRVLCINYDTCKVTCYGLYSRTTAKHISWFMREKCMDYYIAKKCYLDYLVYNFVEKKYSPILE